MSSPTPYRSLRLCSSGGGFEALPERNVQADLPEVRRLLEAEGIRVVDARVLLIAATSPEVTISRSGRILFKTQDESAARSAFERIARIARFEQTLRPAVGAGPRG